ncbi:MAG TPA: ATP-binding protein [Steroidobacteraceae bacterium]|jgi:PAS domain S-box-containing protein|nr:ATP-binding protein [Steroidobacteraceae bacterium]
MSDALLPAQAAHYAEVRAPAYIGPLIPDHLWPWRYLAAVAVVFAVVGVRFGLAPLLGTQAPLLPFVLAVFVSTYLGGLGPGFLASILTPVAATVWFTAWPHDALPIQWTAHVAFFVMVAAIATCLIHELQRSSREQLQALRDAAASEENMRKSAAQLKLIADAMPALISYIAPDGTYRFTNRQYENWFGSPAEQLIGRHVRDVLGAEAYEAVRPRLERALKGERVFFEQEMHYATGSREVAVHYIPDLDAQGNVRGCFALVEDVSARKRAERALREADRRKDEFLAILGHELRNPLAPILNVAHVLSRGNADAATVRRSAELIERQANHMAHLVDDLLDVGRIMRGRIGLEREPLELAAVVDSAIDSMRPQLDARHLAVHVDRGSHVLGVSADSIRLCQVVSNLLANAIKYSPDGARIDVTLQAAGNEAMVSVRDQGCGIDPQMLPHVFDQFLQGDRTLDRANGGLGIGLTVVRYLVEMHGGRVEAHSEGLGRGSDFRIYLPRVAAAQELLPGSAGQPPRPGVRRRVLVVEDNPDAAESLRELLRLHHHEVEVANDGPTALRMLDAFRADVVLLDIGLPRMDGYMVAHAIRARFAHLHLRPRLLALTGYARDEDRHSALRSGFDGHLVKPVEPERLLQMIADEGLWQATASEAN